MSGKGESAAPTTGAITWKDGDKHLCIMPGTWALKGPKKSGPCCRAELLNKGSLNTTWQKLSDDLKLKYKALRDQQPPVPRAEKKKTAAKRERDERRQGLKFEVGRAREISRTREQKLTPMQRRRAIWRWPSRSDLRAASLARR